MAQAHRFGGEWTDEKLKRLGNYLQAYTRIFKKNERAAHFQTIYVDAFAGTGYRASANTDAAEPMLFDGDADGLAEELQKGSALIALENEPSFDHFLFIERKADFARQLRELLNDRFPGKVGRTRILQGEANQHLTKWIFETNWRTHRAVVFLDPYGMEVEWETIAMLAKTQAVDLWILFPLGQAVNRLLTNTPPDGRWADKLTRFFGTDGWKQAFYKTTLQGNLFSTDARLEKDADYAAIGSFFLQRLSSIFAGVSSRALPLRNSRGVPIYLLCFAASNERGAPTAIKIANDILKDFASQQSRRH